MDAESGPLPAPEDLATDRLVAAVESAIGGIQERFANLAADGQDVKWSISGLVRNQNQGSTKMNNPNAENKYKKDLNELQEKRKTEKAAELEEARLLFQLADSQGLAYDPKEDGFVFSLRQIKVHAERHHRLILAKRTEQDYRKRNNLTEITRAAGKVA